MSRILSRRERIKKGIRKRIAGSNVRPRLSVFRSNTAIYAQLIDDVKRITLVSASSREINKDAKSVNINAATEVGKLIAKKAKDKGFDKAVFDRNGYLYHGRIKALADGAREGGLQF